MSIHSYAKPSITTDMVLLRVRAEQSVSKRKLKNHKLEILLVKRQTKPQKDMLSLPGGFVNIEEDLETNVLRKVFEKTGVSGNYYIEQLLTKGELARDPRGRVISVSYIGLGNKLNLTEITKNNAKWYDISLLIQGFYGELAFDHKDILLEALNRLKNKIEYTDIAFNLVSDTFTIAELKTVYELILGNSISNFRRKLQDYLEETGETQEGYQYRPASLYRLNKNRKSRF